MGFSAKSTVLVITLVFHGLVAQANDDLTAQAGIVSDYVFRGISQTDNSAALQAGAEYRHSKGPYFGAWGSKVDLPSGSDVELDIYGGLSNELVKSNIGWDLGYILYRYNESMDNFEEFYGSLSFDAAPTVTLITKLSRDQDNGVTVAEMMGVFKVKENISFKARPGYVNASGSGNDYRFFQLGAGLDIPLKRYAKKLAAELSFSDTDINNRSSRTESIWWLSLIAHF
ncbi:MAG: TorF family putative porin [Gammaproteobacteria bacterium]|nr:TorF family putative porin [Gammaproteobacteria bacterium]